MGVPVLHRRHRAAGTSQKTDVIYTLDRTIAPKIAAVVSRLTGCPMVLWSAYPGYPNEGRWNRVVLQQARHIHVHSRFLQERLLPFVSGPGHLTTIPCALQLERYSPGRSGAPARAALGIAEDTPLILMPGRLSPFKGQEDLNPRPPAPSSRSAPTRCS